MTLEMAVFSNRSIREDQVHAWALGPGPAMHPAGVYRLMDASNVLADAIHRIRYSERKTIMEATLTRPLPLQLTKPVELAPSLEGAIKAALTAENTTYNPETQVRENPEGIPQFFDHNGTSSGGQCNTFGLGNLVQIDADVTIDDNDVL